MCISATVVELSSIPTKLLVKFIQSYAFVSFSGLFNLKTKYDESDNVMVRASRVVTDKLQDVFSK